MRAETCAVCRGGSNRASRRQGLARGNLPAQDPHPDLLPDGRRRRAEPVVLFANTAFPSRRLKAHYLPSESNEEDDA